MKKMMTKELHLIYLDPEKSLTKKKIQIKDKNFTNNGNNELFTNQGNNEQFTNKGNTELFTNTGNPDLLTNNEKIRENNFINKDEDIKNSSENIIKKEENKINEKPKDNKNDEGNKIEMELGK